MYSLPPSIFALIRQLYSRKQRSTRQMFVVEGIKSVKELLSAPHIRTECVVMTTDAAGRCAPWLAAMQPKPTVYITSPQKLSQLSQLTTNESILALAYQPDPPSVPQLSAGRIIALLNLQDPGNLGTILRIADWYGLDGVVCDRTTVDCYNSKAIQASMGSFTRIPVLYTDLHTYLKKVPLPVFAATLSGPLYSEGVMRKEMVLLLGNESHGIPPDWLELCAGTLTIPRYGGAESLNVAMAAAILVNHWRSGVVA